MGPRLIAADSLLPRIPVDGESEKEHGIRYLLRSWSEWKKWLLQISCYGILEGKVHKVRKWKKKIIFLSPSSLWLTYIFRIVWTVRNHSYRQEFGVSNLTQEISLLIPLLIHLNQVYFNSTSHLSKTNFVLFFHLRLSLIKSVFL